MNHLLTLGCVLAYLALGNVIVLTWRAIWRARNKQFEAGETMESEENSGQGY